MTEDPVGGRVLVVAPSEPGDGSFVRGGDAPGTDIGGAGATDGGGQTPGGAGATAADGESDAPRVDRTGRTPGGTDEPSGESPDDGDRGDRGCDPETVAGGIADRLPVEVVLRDERTAREYLAELGPTIDCVVVPGGDTGPSARLADDVSIPAVVCERPVVETAAKPTAEGIPVAAVAERVRAVVREARSRSDLRDQNTRLTALSRYARDITGCETVDAVLERTLEAATDALAFDHCAVLLAEGERLVPRASEIPDPELSYIPTSKGIAGRTLSSGTAEVVADMQSDPDAITEHNDLRAIVSVPIGSRGVLQITSHDRDAFDERDKEFAEILSGYTREALARLEREVSLRAERDRLHALYLAIPVPVLCVEDRGRKVVVTEVNDAYEATFTGNPVGQSLSTAVPVAAERDRYEAALADEAGSRGTVVRRVGDRETDVELTVIPVAPPDGSRYAFGVYRTEPVEGDVDRDG